jgi:hypothetical protein
MIQAKFSEEFIYLTSDQLLLFGGNMRDTLFNFEPDMIMTESQKAEISDLKDSIAKLFFNKEDLIKSQPEAVDWLAGKGYVFVQQKGSSVEILVPEELKVYYKQLQQVFKKHTDSRLTLKAIKEYVIAFSERCEHFEAGEDYFSTSLLDDHDYGLIVDSDLKARYYFLTEEEIVAYANSNDYSLDAKEIFADLEMKLLNDTVIADYPSKESISFTDAVKSGDEDVVDAYNDILEKILMKVLCGTRDKTVRR